MNKLKSYKVSNRWWWTNYRI